MRVGAKYGLLSKLGGELGDVIFGWDALGMGLFAASSALCQWRNEWDAEWAKSEL